MATKKKKRENARDIEATLKNHEDRILALEQRILPTPIKEVVSDEITL